MEAEYKTYIAKLLNHIPEQWTVQVKTPQETRLLLSSHSQFQETYPVTMHEFHRLASFKHFINFRNSFVQVD